MTSGESGRKAACVGYAIFGFELFDYNWPRNETNLASADLPHTEKAWNSNKGLAVRHANRVEKKSWDAHGKPAGWYSTKGCGQEREYSIRSTWLETSPHLWKCGNTLAWQLGQEKSTGEGRSSQLCSVHFLGEFPQSSVGFSLADTSSILSAYQMTVSGAHWTKVVDVVKLLQKLSWKLGYGKPRWSPCRTKP